MFPNHITNLLRLANAHLQAGRLQEAVEIYARIRSTTPSLAEAWQLGGIAAHQQGRYAEASRLLQQAHRLQPNNPDVAAQLAGALIAAGSFIEAEKVLQATLKVKSDHFDALFKLGLVYQILNKGRESIAAYRLLTTQYPNSIEGWTRLGNAHSLLGEYLEACEAYQRAIELDPKNTEARFGRGRTLIQLNCVREALVDIDAVLVKKPKDLDALSLRLFALNCIDGVSRERIFEEHKRYGQLVESPKILGEHSKRRWLKPLSPERPLRVAFLSSDLRRHSVASFIMPLIAHLDPLQFEVILYHDHYKVDQVSEQLRQHAKIWRNFVGLPSATVEQTIFSDQIDVLFDLAGHSNSSRLPLFAHRLAPVQATYLGYPNTTGLRSMDYRLTDGIADPEGVADDLCTERLLRFAPTAWSYMPPVESPDVALPPSLESGRITFGSFNSRTKLNRTTLDLWSRVLKKVPNSQLLVKGYPMPADIWEKMLEDSGVPKDQVVVLGYYASISEHLKCYSRLDIALDPHPYNGTTTTCEAMWMGVPVITLAGDRHSSRVGASLLTSVGHPEWVASTTDDYVERAAGLANDRDHLISARAKLRGDMIRSPLLDQAGQAHRFGEAIRTMWRETCARHTL